MPILRLKTQKIIFVSYRFDEKLVSVFYNKTAFFKIELTLLWQKFGKLKATKLNLYLCKKYFEGELQLCYRYLLDK